MLKGLRQLLLLLVAFALVSGTTAEFAHTAQYMTPMTMDGVPCNMAMAAASGDAQPGAPCKGMTPDCMKMMGCVSVSDSVMPARFAMHDTVVQYLRVAYPTVASKLAGLDHQPDPFPPRTT